MAIDTTEERQQQLSFPQRYWLLIVIVVAIVSPIIVGWLDAAAHQHNYREATEQRAVGGGSGAADTTK
jgi:hypothetical protein